MMHPEVTLANRPIESIMASGGHGGRVRHIHSLAPAEIALPALPTGRHFFDLWPVREWPEQGLWARDSYQSYAPPVFVLQDVWLHSSAGILSVGGEVVGETLAGTDPSAHFYRRLAKGIALPSRPVPSLPGVHISLLAAGAHNYGPMMLQGLARLQAVPDNYLAAAQGLLLPQRGFRQREAMELLDLSPSLAIREVAADASFRVETLILPLSVTGEADYHPCVGDFFHRLAANATPSAKRWPRRFYIDRRALGVRPLANEAELIGALAGMGIVPVRLEDLSLRDQIALFRHAELIVAPHGAGLTNIGFARPGCQVIELLMDSYVDWRYRTLAALLNLRYDCVLGRAAQPWPDLWGPLNGSQWRISIQHVTAAIAQAEGVTAAAA